jgi:hypothetical protein
MSNNPRAAQLPQAGQLRCRPLEAGGSTPGRTVHRVAGWVSKTQMFTSLNFLAQKKKLSQLGCPFLCPGSKASSCEGTPGPSLGPPAGAHTTAVDDRRLPPVRRGSAGADHRPRRRASRRLLP